MTDEARPARERVEDAAELLRQLWGDDLPAGPAPWISIAADVLRLDDETAGWRGLVGAADGLSVATLAELVEAAPADAPVRLRIPPGLLSRVAPAPPVASVAAASALAPVVSLAARRVGARAAMVHVLQRGLLHLVGSAGLTAGEQQVFAELPTGTDGVLCRALRSGEPVQGPHRYDDPVLGARLITALALPFSGRAGVRGGLVLVWDGDRALPDGAVAESMPTAEEAERLLSPG